MNIKNDLKNLNKVLPVKYLKRNSIYYSYISYIAHISVLFQTEEYRSCTIFIQRSLEFIYTNEIKNDFEAYVIQSRTFMKRIYTHFNKNNLLEPDVVEMFPILSQLDD